MKATARRLPAAAALAALFAAALALPGCSNSCTCPDEIQPVYPARTSPENVLQKLNLAYIYKDIDAYMDCLADSFRFYPSPDDVGDPYWGLPETWNKAVEESIHQRMFGAGSGVDQVRLALTTVNVEFEWNAGDSIWRYTEFCDLRVTYGIITYYAGTPQIFVLEADEERIGRDGEELWAIVEWYELDDDWARLGESCTWGSIKWLFR